MAKMIPAEIDPEAPPSEREIFRRFRDQTPPEWTAIHSQGFVQPADRSHPALDGEIDFLLVVPDRGFLVLEVKGGGIHFHKGQWFSKNHRGETNAIKDPAAQARRGAHAVENFLRGRSWFKSRQVRPRFGWGVIFPDVDLPANTGLALPRDHVIDRLDCTRFTDEITRLMDTQGLTPRKYPPELPDKIVEAINPPIDVRVPLAKWFAEEDRQQRKFTEEQVRLLDVLADERRLAIEGCAGSGKTVVAMEKARRLANDGLKVLFLCFNQPLAEELKSQTEDFPVFTFHDFSIRFLQQAGVHIEVPKGRREKSKFYEEELPLSFLEALGKHSDERYDAIVVDEGQDFKQDWWDCVRDLLEDPQAGTWYVFFDPLQDIYGRGIPKMLDLYPYPLRYNCRNTGRIAAFCGEVSQHLIETFPGAPEGREVELLEAKSAAALQKLLGKRLETLVSRDKIDPRDIVLLSTRSRKTSAFKGVSKLGPLRLVPLDAQPAPNQLRFESLFRFKGLEADVVLLIDEGHPRTSTPNHLYVGASRARHWLTLARLKSQSQTDPD